MPRIHTCEWCDYTTTKSSNMYRHVAGRHSDPPESNSPERPKLAAAAAGAPAGAIQQLTEFKDLQTEWFVDHILLRRIPVHLLDVTKIQALIEYLTTEVFSENRNLCIRKYSSRVNYSFVYFGGEWHMRTDAYLYNSIFSSICNRVHDVIHSQMGTRVYRTHIAVFDKAKHYLNYLADDGVCNDAEDTKEVAKIHKNLINFLPAFIHFQCEKAGLVRPGPRTD